MFVLNRIAQVFGRKRERASAFEDRNSRRRSSCRSVRIGFNTDGGYRDLRFAKSFVVGSDPSCNLSFPDSDLSSRHAEIYRLGDRWWVRDLGSTDGTYLDGEIIDAAPVDGKAAVRLGLAGPTIWLDTRSREFRSPSNAGSNR